MRTIVKLVMAMVLVLGAVVAAPPPAAADGVADEADLQFDLGNKAFQRKDFEAALAHYLASNRLVRNRNVLFNIAFTYKELRRFPDAYRYFVDALEGEKDQSVRGDIENAMRDIADKVAVLEVQSTPPGAQVYLNRKDLGAVARTPARIGLAAGTYIVIVEAEGYELTQSRPIEVRLGSR
ncbi:MAG: PEGA domain-containing protein, partial [Kofleriaceae bacterium]|nr:PEGA domain-containing protein [Kofleriaceae bacterium]